MQWVHATEAKKQEVNPFCPYGCKFRTGPRAGTPIPDTWIHTFLCTGSGAADMATTRHNAACRIIERAIKQGEKGRATLLRNYGRQDEAPEEETVPQWILPVHCRGPGPMADSPDFMIVEGIPRHAPRPTGPLANEFFEGDQRISCKLTIGEVKYTDDLKMPAAHERAASKYQGRPQQAGGKTERRRLEGYGGVHSGSRPQGVRVKKQPRGVHGARNTREESARRPSG
jgi:hypothetical protein